MKKIFVFLLILTCFSCKRDILDIVPLDRVTEDVTWSDENLMRAYHTELYNSITHNFGVHMYSKMTDEAHNTAANGPIIFANGSWNPDNITSIGNADNNYMYYWDRGYGYLRKILVFMERMSTTKVQFADKARLLAEAKFLRAFIYFNLLERYGGVPIVAQSYGLQDAINTTTKFTRATIDETVAYIDKDLTEAIPDLPEKYVASDAAFGRATKDVCRALRSRLYLYAASPLFSTSNDKVKWQKAADAAEALLNRGYSLYPDYRLSFNRPSGAANSELIFARQFTAANSHQAPMHNIGRRYGGYGGWWASNGPSQNLVDDYDMINGEPAFNWAGNVKTVNPASAYDATHPYDNRDPRFDATIIRDEGTYHGDTFEMWIASDNKTWGTDSYKQSSDNPRDGYILKKFMPDADVPLTWQTQYTIPWPVFRLGEIYLNYAEAKFELGDEATAREYLNKIRARPTVSMPPIPVTVTGDALRQRIYNERRIELAFEGHRFFDVRRWKIAKVVEARPIYGIDIIKNVTTSVKTYTPVKLLDRTFEDKMYFLPIENNEIRRNDPNLAQSPLW